MPILNVNKSEKQIQNYDFEWILKLWMLADLPLTWKSEEGVVCLNTDNRPNLSQIYPTLFFFEIWTKSVL